MYSNSNWLRHWSWPTRYFQSASSLLPGYDVKRSNDTLNAGKVVEESAGDGGVVRMIMVFSLAISKHHNLNKQSTLRRSLSYLSITIQSSMGSVPRIRETKRKRNSQLPKPAVHDYYEIYVGALRLASGRDDRYDWIESSAVPSASTL